MGCYRGGYNSSILIGETVNNATRSKHVFCNQALNYKLCRKEVKLVFLHCCRGFAWTGACVSPSL